MCRDDGLIGLKLQQNWNGHRTRSKFSLSNCQLKLYRQARQTFGNEVANRTRKSFVHHSTQVFLIYSYVVCCNGACSFRLVVSLTMLLLTLIYDIDWRRLIDKHGTHPVHEMYTLPFISHQTLAYSGLNSYTDIFLRINFIIQSCYMYSIYSILQ